MRKKYWVMIVMAMVLVVPCSVWAGDFLVTKIYSGDTVKIKGHDIEAYVKLIGIDAPEMKTWKVKEEQPYAKKAKSYLSNRIYNMNVNVIGYGMGPFNQLMALIYIDGKNINLEMIEMGLAEVDEEFLPKYFDIKPFKTAQEEAKKKKVGMWSQGETYVSPKRWREMSTIVK